MDKNKLVVKDKVSVEEFIKLIDKEVKNKELLVDPKAI